MDSNLIEKAKEGDREVITAIVRTYQRVIRNYTGRFAPDPMTADDIAQEVFLTLIRSLDKVDPARGIQAYLFGIARNLIKRSWRATQQAREVSGEKLFSTMSACDQNEISEDLEGRRLDALQGCLKTLAPKAHEVILRHYREEERCQDIAASINVKTSSVRAILTRARIALYQCIQKNMHSEGLA